MVICQDEEELGPRFLTLARLLQTAGTKAEEGSFLSIGEEKWDCGRLLQATKSILLIHKAHRH